MVQLKIKPTFAIHTLGCKVNTYESDAMAAALKAAGFEERDFEEQADVYLINTCTVTNIADRKSRQMLRRARKVNPDAVIVAAGCYVDDAIKNDKLTELMEEHVIDVAVSNKDKGRAADIICSYLEEHFSANADAGQDSADTGQANADAGQNDAGSGNGNSAVPASQTAPRYLTELDGHSRAFIKVQDGCNMFCTYCIIPYVRGRLQARPLEDVLEEIRGLAGRGITETVITGIHLSSLGDGLLEILAGIEEIDGILRVRLGSLEPTLITRDFTRRMQQFEKLCPHFHLSLQSGSDYILKKMNRHYTTAQFEESCRILREAYPHPAITTDIIVGFPGETEEHFEETCSFAERIGFYEAHVFKYSRRKGTPADRMPDQLTEAVKAARSERLIDITDSLSEAFRQDYLHKKTEFLSEELVEEDGILYETGYNREYVRCLKPADRLHANSIVRGTAERLETLKPALGQALILK